LLALCISNLVVVSTEIVVDTAVAIFLCSLDVCSHVLVRSLKRVSFSRHMKNLCDEKLSTADKLDPLCVCLSVLSTWSRCGLVSIVVVHYCRRVSAKCCW